MNNVLVRPFVTEKSTGQMDEGHYAFVVDKSANKIEIRKAVEAHYPGVVVADVPTAVARYQKDAGLPVFARQPPQPNFAALGTDTGLVMLVPPGRPWFPTDVPSAAFPLEVEIHPTPGFVSLIQGGRFLCC